jgi:mono/diheme cytochrome c family protein
MACRRRGGSAYRCERVTEVPDHLLRRSRERRAALGLGGGEEGGEKPAAEGAPATPATTAETAPAAAPSGPPGRQPPSAPPAAPPPKPDPPYVAAAKARAKIPIWALAALSLMPIWAFMYVRALTVPPEVATGPLGVGAEVYSNCASCHGGSGQGGSGRPLAAGEVLKTFPHIEDQLRFVYFGTEQYNIEGVENYGNPDREGGAHTTGSFGPMPAWGTDAGGDLTDEEILAVVCHERYTLGGAQASSDEYAAEFENWCAEDAPAFVNLEEGGTLADLDEAGLTTPEGDDFPIIDIGDAPRAGTALSAP